MGRHIPVIETSVIANTRPEHERRVLLVRRNGEEYAIAVHHPSSEMRVSHELSHLLRAWQVTGKKMLRPCQAPLQRRQIGSVRQFGRVPGDRHTMGTFPNKSAVQMPIEVLRRFDKACRVNVGGPSSFPSELV